MARCLFAATWLALVAVLVPSAPAASVTLAVPNCQAVVGSEIKIPIRAQQAEGAGSFQLELAYDPAMLQFEEVEEGAMLSGAMLAANVVAAGRLKIAGVGDPQKPLQGDGELVLVRFRVLDGGGQGCPLQIENALAWEQTPAALDMLVRTEPGQFTAQRPVRLWLFVAAISGLLVAIAILFVIRKKTAGKG